MRICQAGREVVLAWTDDPEDPQYELSMASLRCLESERDARGRPLQCTDCDTVPPGVCDPGGSGRSEFEPGEDEREAGERLAASYVNFYISNGGVILPQFGDENDRTAVGDSGGLFPERKIYPIFARDILVGGG